MMQVPPSLKAALEERYRIERELGAGGMATVYLAHDVRHERDVALKVLRPELAAILGRERFLTEIRLTAKLDHPHILTLIDSGESSGFLWYALPFVRGESLRHRLEREGQLGVPEALAIAGDIAGALEYAHRRGVIHRDVKPENILLHEGEAMLTDFGIALALHEAGGERLTETGLSVGTPQYMSPEQAMAERRLGARTDIYSLGAVLYEMLAGEPPFSGATGQAVIAKLMTVPPTPVRMIRDTVPEHVDAAITRALAKAAADRFPTAASFGDALRGTTAASSGSPQSYTSGKRSALLAGLVLLSALAALAFRLIGTDVPSRKPAPDLAALDARAQHSLDRRTRAGVLAAIADYSAVVRRDSTHEPAWTGLSKSYIRAYIRNYPLPGISHDSTLRLAVWAVERALATNPGSAEAWVAQAMVSRAVDPTDLTPAFRAVRRALALDSTSGPAWHNLALNLAETGNFPGAMSAWHRSMAVAPTYAEGAAFLGQALYWRHEYDSAQAWLDSAVALDANFILPRTVGGYVALERGDVARGIAAFDAAARLGDDIEVVNAEAGSALAEARAGRLPRARAILRQADSLALGYAPTPLHTAVFLAEAYGGVGDIDHALAWLAKVEPRNDLHFQLHLRCDAAFAPIAANRRFLGLIITPRPPAGSGC